jgi:membrane-bound ClpP family serine protease
MIEGIRISLYIGYLALGVILIGVLILFFIWYDKDKRPVSGRHILLGQIGRAKISFPAGKLGKVYIFGEYWDALCDEDLELEQAIRVTEVHDKFVRVVPSDRLPDQA